MRAGDGRSESVPWNHSVSGLRNNRYGASVRAAPWFQAGERYRFVSLRTRRAPGTAAMAASALPSWESLSMTTMSVARSPRKC